MSYCTKCGNKIEENMAFCPRCGAPLKLEVEATSKYHSQRGEKAEKNEKQEKGEKQEKNEKQEKGEYGFFGWLIGGAILILIGVLSILQFSNIIPSGTMGPVLLLTIGGLIIIAAIYYIFSMKKRNPPT